MNRLNKEVFYDNVIGTTYAFFRYFFTAGQDKALRVWSLETLEFLQDLRGHSGFVRCLEVAPGVAQVRRTDVGLKSLTWPL